jgi:hypothetical protein
MQQQLAVKMLKGLRKTYSCPDTHHGDIPQAEWRYKSIHIYLGTRWRWVVSLKLQPKSLQEPLNRGLGFPSSSRGVVEKEKYFVHAEFRIPRRLTWILKPPWNYYLNYHKISTWLCYNFVTEELGQRRRNSEVRCRKKPYDHKKEKQEN